MLRNPPAASNDVYAEDEVFDDYDGSHIKIEPSAPNVRFKLPHEQAANLPLGTPLSTDGLITNQLPIQGGGSIHGPISANLTDINTATKTPQPSGVLERYIESGNFSPEDTSFVKGFIVKLIEKLPIKTILSSENTIKAQSKKSTDIEDEDDDDTDDTPGHDKFFFRKTFSEKVLSNISDELELAYGTGIASSKSSVIKNDQQIITSYPVNIPINVESMTRNCGNEAFLKFISEVEAKLQPQISKLVTDTFASKHKPLDVSCIGKLIENKETGYTFLIEDIKGNDVIVREVEFDVDGAMEKMNTTQTIGSHIVKDEFKFL